MTSLGITRFDVAIGQRRLCRLQRVVAFVLLIVVATHAATFQEGSHAILK